MKPDLIDEAVAQLRQEPIDVATAQAAGRRVWTRLEEELGSSEPSARQGHVLGGCADFRTLLAAHAEGALPAERRLLLEDHLHECPGCRRAYAAVRGEAKVRPFASRERRVPLVAPRWALAAALALAVTGLAYWFAPFLPFFAFGGPLATVESIDGQLFRFEGDRAVPLAAGTPLSAGSPVRAAGASNAVLRLADGSRLEVAPRSEVAVARVRDGLRVELSRGSVILEAAKQRDGHLYVRTTDCQVSVVGTIFSVHSGPVGSRVAVLEGEVRVKHGEALDVLHPGDRVATGPKGRGEHGTLGEEFAWSRNAPAYRERLTALAALGQELEREVANIELRSSTRLLDLAPAGTVVWAAAPNSGDAVARAWRLVQQRAGESPVLSSWWQQSMAGERETEMSALVDRLERLSRELGPEVAMAMQRSGEPPSELTMLALAEAPRPDALAALIDQELAAAQGSQTPGTSPKVRRVTDPRALSGPAVEGELLLWIGDGLLVASNRAAALREVAERVAGTPGTFTASPFYARIAERYARGAGWLLALDTESLLATSGAGVSPEETAAETARHRAELERLGFADLRTVIVESRDLPGGTDNGGRLEFARGRRGVASWLETASPMGALDLVSPEATVAVAALLKNPAGMLEDLLAIAEAGGEVEARAKLEAFEREQGVAVSADLAGSLGGEMAFALDGPVLPVPTWKLIVEVTDEPRLLVGLADLVAAASSKAVEAGEPEMHLSQEVVDGRVYHRIGRAGPLGGAGVEFTFVGGYLLAGPNRAALRNSLDQHAAGLRLPDSQAFRTLLAASAPGELSALAYQNLGLALGPLAEAGQALAGQAAELSALASLAAERGPSLGWAVASPAEIELGTSGAPGPLALVLEGWLLGSAFDGAQGGQQVEAR